MQASQDGDVEMVKILIAAGAKLDHQSKVIRKYSFQEI